jgi:hypothetical protein
MSRKWQETQRWDAQHLTGVLFPVRVVLHTLSSIWLAVILLTLIACYGALASIPIGLVALIPTWLVITASAMAAIVLGGGLGVLAVRASVPRSKPGWRFAASVVVFLLGATGGAWAWWAGLWPRLEYHPTTGQGLRFFADFVERYDSTTLRRLPGFEMSELEFYSWWPLRVVLLLFVLNMVVATARRIEFTFKNLGVLTVHTGIIVISLGSVYYQALKKEGDALLRAGTPDASGSPGMGPPVRGFYDNTYVALWVAQRSGMGGAPLWEARPLRGVPRYNDYGLDQAPPIAASARVIGHAEELWAQPQRPLDLSVPPGSVDPMLGAARVDADIKFRVVGYAEYATPGESLIVVDGPSLDQIPPERRLPLRTIDLLSRVPGQSDPDRPVFTFTLRPTQPAARLSGNDVIAVEYTRGMSEARRAALLTPLPEGTRHALVVEIPGSDGAEPTRAVVPAEIDRKHAIGETGWTVTTKRLAPRPPFAIVTPGYEGAESSLAIVEITPPGGAPFERWVYHRFEEISQDLTSPDGSGRPTRKNADSSIRVSYIDASKLQIYFDEPEPGRIDMIVREPAGGVRLVERIGLGQRVEDVVEQIDLRITGAYDHAAVFEHPVPVPESERNNQLVGTHAESMLAVEVAVGEGSGAWSTVVWVPFLQYLGTDPGMERRVTLPDGRSLTLQFGRVWHGFPGFAVQLADFQMIAYDHRGAPRDYQSIVRVAPTEAGADFEPYEHVVKLNAPLRAPYIWSESRSLVANAALRMTSGINPNQFKLSQSGWDRDGWMQTQQMADAGQLPRPFARYTILQVGNNPGIHVIALGSVLMAIGIPWAFYVKPWLVRREKQRLAELAAARGKGRNAPEQPAPVTEEAAAAVGQS